MRGERSNARRVASDDGGSSPHARGTQAIIQLNTAFSRFIPACAGNAPRPTTRSSLPAVHPRMRGERSRIRAGRGYAPGSSPHARGTHRTIDWPTSCGRFIPACAGNACAPSSPLSDASVHPRMRGERWSFGQWIDQQVGSSPHARGTRLASERMERPARFIPACAGNASPSRADADWIAVHPRMRGERADRDGADLADHGSSPHARGTPRLDQVRGGRRRFIPACAGNAPTRNAPPMPRPVHPRMRGERSLAEQQDLVVDGSSPHARGTRARSPSSAGRIRFIPACAGNADSR